VISRTEGTSSFGDRLRPRGDPVKQSARLFLPGCTDNCRLNESHGSMMQIIIPSWLDYVSPEAASGYGLF
jgi:hypothetical protein